MDVDKNTDYAKILYQARYIHKTIFRKVFQGHSQTIGTTI